MKNYGIEMEGKFYLEQLASVPGWNADDESRIVYDQTSDKLYFGSGSEWVELASIDDVEAVAAIPAGTYMLFAQASAPIGWTRDLSISHSSHKRTIMLADDSENGALTGGSYDLAGLDISHVHSTSGHALTLAQMPQHRHYSSVYVVTGYPDHSSGQTYMVGSNTNLYTDYQGSGSSHSHGNTASGGGTISPRYVTIIIATKD
jgi:hypothetical protein